MKITRLIDDYSDESLRNYWKNNLDHLLSVPIKNTVAQSPILFNPMSSLVVHSLDYHNVSMHRVMTNDELKHTLKYMDQSAFDIAESFNHSINQIITDIASVHTLEHSLMIERMKLYPRHQVEEVEERERNGRQMPYIPTLNFYSLRYPSKDLLLLAFLANYFGQQISNDELFAFIKEQMRGLK